MKNSSLLRKSCLFVFMFTVFGVISVSAQPDKMKMSEKSLYERLGGYDALAAVSDDFIGRLAADKTLKRFVVGLSDDSKKKLRQHLVEFLCNATGGSCFYLGRDMKTAHAGMGITDKDWDISVKLLVETLDKLKVPDKEKNDVLAAIGGLKDQIVDKK